MRFGKRTLAGVAAGALALGALTIASAPAASAKPSIKLKATATATVAAVRPTGVSPSTIALPRAVMAWSSKAAGMVNTLGNAATRIDVTTAPTATAKLAFSNPAVTNNTNNASDDSSIALDDAPVALSIRPFGTVADDSIFQFNVDTAGLYAGQIYNGADTITFSFSTAGAPASMTLAPATQTVLVGAQADLAVNLLDAQGKPTQPQTVDSVNLTRSPTDDTITAIDTLTPAITSISSQTLRTGTGPFSLSTSATAAGTTVVTASPAGTLASSGVTAQTANVVKSGSVSANRVSNLTVTTPANAFTAGTVLAGTRAAQVPNPATSVTLTVDDTPTAAAGNSLRFAVYANSAGAIVNGQAVGTSLAGARFVDVTTDANKKATLTFSLAGTALLANNSITVAQVTVLDAAVANSQIVVTQTAATVQPANVVPTPTTALARVGASTNIVVQVDDSFGTDQVGWIVRAYRTNTSGANLLSTATTGANGQATVTVSPLSTTVANNSETYVFTATAPVGGSPVEAALSTTVNYTASGNITAMSVVPSGTATTAFNNTTSTITTAPVILVPDGTAGVPYGTSAGAVTLATDVDATAPNGNLATFTVTTTPANNVVATVSAASGLYLSATAPGATTAWSSGAQTVTVGGAGSTPVFVWATKTGTHDIVFTSGGITLTGKVKVANRAQDAYNIAVTPDKANVAKGGFTTLTAKVTDFWGNPVATTAGAITGTAAGEVLLAGNTNTATFGTNAAGEASITVIAANAAGAGTVTLTPTTAGAPPAWAAGYTKPASFTTAPTLTAVSLITVGEAPVTTSITITGSRTTVSGKPGITVDGITVGIEDGKTVTPFIRFPGETTFTAGSARPAITNDEVTWQRKTGKRVTVYLELSDDATIKSNRVTIQAN